MFESLRKSTTAIVFALGVLAPGMVNAQNGSSYQHRNDRFYDGARNAGRGDYYGGRDHRYDDRYNGQYQGHGIGTGRGALIGGAGGAALGALFGGGLKGSLIGGAAGAGVGAVVGHAHQQSQKRKYYERRDGYYRR